MSKERASTPPSLKALLSGRVTSEKRNQIRSWLSGRLNPDQSPPSAKAQTVQGRSMFGGGPDPTLSLALGMLGGQYPASAERSPTAQVSSLLDYQTAAQRNRQTGHISVSPLELPDYDARVVTPSSAQWSQRFLGLLDTLRHEYSHGMGHFDNPLPGDNRDEFPTSYDVGKVSARLHEDIDLPPEKKRGTR